MSLGLGHLLWMKDSAWASTHPHIKACITSDKQGSSLAHSLLVVFFYLCVRLRTAYSPTRPFENSVAYSLSPVRQGLLGTLPLRSEHLMSDPLAASSYHNRPRHPDDLQPSMQH